MSDTSHPENVMTVRKLRDAIAGPEPVCPVGVNGHRYVLTIEEGEAYIDLADGEECPEWERYAGLGPRSVCLLVIDDLPPEDIASEPIPVALEWIVDRGYSPDDVYCYVNLSPESEKDRSRVSICSRHRTFDPSCHICRASVETQR